MKFFYATLTLLAITCTCAAEDLGIRGDTYKPDRDGREQLRDAVREKQRSGELDRYWREYRDKTIESIKHPAPLGVPTDYVKHSETRELRFTIPQDFRDQNGRIVVSKGTVVEPLKYKSLQESLVFIDGRDQRQVDYAIGLGVKRPVKIILTAGSPFDLRVKYQGTPWMGGTTIPFYFDQRKAIINSFKLLYQIDLSSVPVVLTQVGQKMVINFGM